ncbi:MAG: DegT/DnrJ/EryC1/StrS family aminotransferase [Dehalococcoidia bacterium]|nr:DegT/DnrJ/EryC1/StrS family aminotransferase [Dehalococcoidia bacterium]
MIKLAHPQIDDDDRAAVLAALDSGQLAQGPRVAAFEQAFAAFVAAIGSTRPTAGEHTPADAPDGTDSEPRGDNAAALHAIAVSSGTAALHLALLAHEIGDDRSRPGSPDLRPPSDPRPLPADTPDEVIVPAFSFAATANAVLHAGARPVFVDVRDEDFGIDVAQAAAAITPRTRAVIAVHLYGQTCDVGSLAEVCARRGIALIEDAAQAVGASMAGRAAGAWGTGCFSLYATKNLQTGEGGMITTRDATVAAAARLLRSQGERERYVTEALGYNFRLTEVAAALGLSQLAKLAARSGRRRANAARLSGLLAANRQIVAPRELPGRRHVWHQYTVRVRAGAAARARLQAALRERGIESATFYPTPIHRQPLYRRLGYGNLDLPVASRLASEALSLPVHPALSDDEIDAVASTVNEITGAW